MSVFRFATNQPEHGAPFGQQQAGLFVDPSISCQGDFNQAFTGSYVPAERYARGWEADSYVGTACQRKTLTDYSEAGRADMMPGASGMSARSLDALGGRVPYGGPFQFAGAGAAPIDRRDPFAGVVIPEARPTGYLDGVMGTQEFLTTNYNQSRDLRGDIPVTIRETPTGASMSTQGGHSMVVAYRGNVY
ncbi:hypothetical protein [Medusavirus stheno T3]|uniref:Uncharacterized protein n=1 Tax=Medusavirus stheno T3 TaxID=3069717 RepID=A0A7S7YEE8_9VIRU|nr:hypothetical protein QKU73_gp067 [Acanthamoeba castellanii medusavirus]QPB44248.1 hypothetical protein [Medusavirus stheno T3]